MRVRLLVGFPVRHFFQVGECGQATVRETVRKLELVFSGCGGVRKAFTAQVLRAKFGKLPGLMRKGKFSKTDFDIIAAKYRDMVSDSVRLEPDRVGGLE